MKVQEWCYKGTGVVLQGYKSGAIKVQEWRYKGNVPIPLTNDKNENLFPSMAQFSRDDNLCP